MQQKLEESRIYQPKFILRDFGHEALKKRKEEQQESKIYSPYILTSPRTGAQDYR